MRIFQPFCNFEKKKKSQSPTYTKFIYLYVRVCMYVMYIFFSTKHTHPYIARLTCHVTFVMSCEYLLGSFYLMFFHWFIDRCEKCLCSIIISLNRWSISSNSLCLLSNTSCTKSYLIYDEKYDLIIIMRITQSCI